MQVTDEMIEAAAKKLYEMRHLTRWEALGERSQDIYRVEARAVLRTTAALSDKQAVEVKIKPLEWHEHGDLDFVWFRATPPVGYRYNIEDDVFTEKRHHVAVGQLSLGHFDTLIEAKAAAQADYEQRIRSALVDVPAVEPVAWRRKWNFRGSRCQDEFTDSAELAELWRGHPQTDEVAPLYTSPLLSREGEDSAEVERLRGLLDVALEALDTYSDPTSYLDSNGEPLPADAEIHEGVYAKETARDLRAALAATRSGSATTASGTASASANPLDK